MKKCITCGHDISDEAAFCPNCGASQNENVVQKTTAPITANAFLRIFRPSFFGSLEYRIARKTDKLLLNFLCLTRDITDEEINEINRAFDILLNNASEEYTLNTRRNYKLSGEDRIPIENEKFRYNFISDKLLDTIKSPTLKNERIYVIWLFALLSALDGQYSDEKAMFFSRIKNLLPVSREDFLAYVEQSVSTIPTVSLCYSISKLFRTTMTAEAFKEENYAPDTPVSTIVNDIPEDFDFYDCVEEKIKKLCALESDIQKLEQSEGKYTEIRSRIEKLTEEEREQIAILPGFEYSKF